MPFNRAPRLWRSVSVEVMNVAASFFDLPVVAELRGGRNFYRYLVLATEDELDAVYAFRLN